MFLVFAISEAISKLSECDNNRVRLDDTAGITTDDLYAPSDAENFFLSTISLI
jgi:hypothetical protein